MPIRHLGKFVWCPGVYHQVSLGAPEISILIKPPHGLRYMHLHNPHSLKRPLGYPINLCISEIYNRGRDRTPMISDQDVNIPRQVILDSS